MRYLKKFNIFTEGAEPAVKPAPSRPGTKPSQPTKPQRPSKPSPGKIERPSADPAPKAEKDKVTEMDVAKRFISEMNKKGESIKKFLEDNEGL